MVNAFGAEISETYQTVMRCLKDYRADQSDENAIALRTACCDHLKTSPRKGEICIPLGILHGLARLGFVRLWLMNAFVGILRIHPQMWNAAPEPTRSLRWNDFEMGGWMVGHDPFYTARIYRRLYYSKGLVQKTCAWMVNSVRQQEPEFADQWSQVNTGFPPQRAETPVRRETNTPKGHI